MQVHVEVDRNFLKGEEWEKSYQVYREFINYTHNKKMVLLELDADARNQLIKAPFITITNVEE